MFGIAENTEFHFGVLLFTVYPVEIYSRTCTTVLAQIEACINSRPLSPLPCDDDGVEVLTPGHFLIGRPTARASILVLLHGFVTSLAFVSISRTPFLA